MAGQDSHNPTDAKLSDLVAEGRQRYADGRFKEARESFQKALELQPKDSDLLNSLANTLCELNGGEWSLEAFSMLQDALQRDPENAKAWNNLGDYYYRKGEFDRAIEAFEKAVTFAPQYATAFVNLSLAYRNTNRSQDAIAAIRKALCLKPGCAWTRFQLGLTYLYRGLRFSCISDIEKAREVFLSVDDMDENPFPADKMVEMLDSYLTIAENQKAIHTFLMESTQYFGDELDDETYGCMLN